MKKLLITALSVAALTVSAFGQSQTLAFDDLSGAPDSGTYAPGDTFSFNVNLTFAGYNAIGLSFWLETESGFASNLSIVNVTYGTFFPDGNQSTPNPDFFNSSQASSGFLSNNRDLGSTVDDPGTQSVAPGTYFVANVTLELGGSAPAGTYTIRSTTTGTHQSVVSDSTFTDHSLPAATYTVTVVPEPATWSMLALGGLIAFGANRLRVRTRR